jgi:hypothetical protein|tara:strand:+ start:1354 stop:1560 length:207 start_codon:yes stop_codon:yes gene_type:complete
MRKIHKSITSDRVYDAVEEQMYGMENPGFCLSCGADHDGCEPDARKYKCHECDKMEVYGAEEVLMMVS